MTTRLFFAGGVLTMFPWIKDEDLIVVADVYDPFHLESLELSRDLEKDAREALIASYLTALNEQLIRADFILCASEKQRDLWIGHLGALGRINTWTYEQDHSLRELIDVVPFGVSESAASQSHNPIKGTIPGISSDDKVIIWGGGIYNWFDTLTLVNAINLLSQTHQNIRLFFMGTGHPNPNVPQMQMVNRTRALSDSLGLTGKFIFFNDGWVDYEDRINYLLDADLGVSTHYEHIETSFSFRTRILDYLWAGLPIVATNGDTFAPIIEKNKLGKVVPPEDPQALAKAIEQVLFSESGANYGSNVNTFGMRMKWSQTLKPLVAFCSDSRHSADYPYESTANYLAALPASVQEVIGTLRTTNSELASHLSALEAQVAHAKNELAAVKGSTSWKITAALRAFKRRVSR